LHSTPIVPSGLDWNLLVPCVLALLGVVAVLSIHKLGAKVRAQNSDA
jgi:hypothetical protein